MKGFKPETPATLSEQERELAESLVRYPALEKIFDSGRPQAVAETKNRLQISLGELERIVRRGSKEEAEKAGRIIKAYETTLNFLAELERRRRNLSK